MIESVEISNVASFGDIPVVLDGLSQFNFFFGSNATGKTTISRVIADATRYPNCGVSWKGGTELQTLCYDDDFVERSFNQPTELRGVFTLGEEQVDTLARIATAKAELDVLTTKI